VSLARRNKRSEHTRGSVVPLAEKGRIHAVRKGEPV
jgi:hypothetical protein